MEETKQMTVFDECPYKRISARTYSLELPVVVNKRDLAPENFSAIRENILVAIHEAMGDALDRLHEDLYPVSRGD